MQTKSRKGKKQGPAKAEQPAAKPMQNNRADHATAKALQQQVNASAQVQQAKAVQQKANQSAQVSLLLHYSSR